MAADVGELLRYQPPDNGLCKGVVVHVCRVAEAGFVTKVQPEIVTMKSFITTPRAEIHPVGDSAPVFLPLFLSDEHWHRAAALFPKSIVTMASAGTAAATPRVHYSASLAASWLCAIGCRTVADLVWARATPDCDAKATDSLELQLVLVLQLLSRLMVDSELASWAAQRLSPADGYPAAALLNKGHLDELMQVFPLLCAIHGRSTPGAPDWDAAEVRLAVLREALRRTVPWLLLPLAGEPDALAAATALPPDRWGELWQVPMTCLSFWIALLRAVRDVGRFDVEQIHLEVSHRRRLGVAVGSTTFDDALALAFDLAPATVAACRCGVLASDGRFFLQELRLLSSAQRAAIAGWAIPGLCGEGLAADLRPLHVVGLGPHSLIEPWDLPVAILGRMPSMGHDCPPIPGLLYLADYITEAAE
eukprot:EG_transcript_14169